MTKSGRILLIFFGALGIAVHLAIWVNDTCSAPEWSALVKPSCTEFWFNRYQTLIAAILAIAGVIVTISAMAFQTEKTRNDEAVLRLSSYVAGLNRVMFRFGMIPRFDSPIDPNARKELIRSLTEAAQDRCITDAINDHILGPDAAIISVFINCVQIVAHQREHSWAGNPGITYSMIHADIMESIFKRRQLLIAGKRVDELKDITLIDHAKVRSTVFGTDATQNT